MSLNFDIDIESVINNLLKFLELKNLKFNLSSLQYFSKIAANGLV